MKDCGEYEGYKETRLDRRLEIWDYGDDKGCGDHGDCQQPMKVRDYGNYEGYRDCGDLGDCLQLMEVTDYGSYEGYKDCGDCGGCRYLRD